jgi:hypothetical protein
LVIYCIDKNFRVLEQEEQDLINCRVYQITKQKILKQEGGFLKNEARGFVLCTFISVEKDEAKWRGGSARGAQGAPQQT